MASETSNQELHNVTDAKIPKADKKKKAKTILDQIEFYFSDANLSKDRFLSELIKESPEGYVDISVFMKFNKIKALANSFEEIVSALTKSTFLHLSEDHKYVKRLTPIKINEQEDLHTIYVENLPSYADHDWIKDYFKSCGKVNYVSLPKFKSSGKLKGFAFVEFETLEAAENACKLVGNRTDAVTTNKKQQGEDDEPATKKRKLDESHLKSQESGRKKRKHEKHSKNKKEKSDDQNINLRVMSKIEWKKYRNKYLTLQKANMAELKKHLVLHNREKLQYEDLEVTDKNENPSKVETSSEAPKFTPNVIIKLELEEPARFAKQLRNEIKTLIGVRYVELVDDAVCGYIRCDCEEITGSVLESLKEKGKTSVIQGEEERTYWDKILQDRNKKLNSKQHPKKRGFDKIIRRAININQGNVATHIRFED